MKYKKRIEALKKRLKIEKVDGLFIRKRENIFYLCGLELEDSALIITAKERDFVITDPRFWQKAKEGLPDFNIKLRDGSPYTIINNVIKKHKIEKLGFESDWLSHKGFVDLKKDLKRADLIPKRHLVEDLRIIKDTEEIRLIKRSAGIVKRAFNYAKKRISPRINGEGLAVLIDNFMRTQGSSRAAFQTIVAQDPYSSCPHGPSTNRLFSKNSSVLIDMGAVFKGYNSDLTRTIFLGRITKKFNHIYNILKSAQNKAIKKIKPGIKISQVDRAARQHIENKGLGKYFLHNLGHGLGLEIHESPCISKNNKGPLSPGMVFTIEPGIYIPGWGGLRLEDMVVVTDDGCEVLTDDIPK